MARTNRSLERSIAALLSSPPRPAKRLRPSRSDASTPPKGPPPAVTDLEASVSPAQLCKVGGAGAVEPVKVVELEAVKVVEPEAALFDGIEDVLELLAERRTRPSLALVRRSVEAQVGRDLTDERLSRILALAGGALEATWVGTGSEAVLELLQRAPDGAARAPTGDERRERRAAFSAALERAKRAGGALPSAPLPGRPGLEEEARAQAQAVAAAVPTQRSQAIMEVGAARTAAAGESRLDALRSRLLARQVAKRSAAAHDAEVRALQHRVQLCEDALAVHSVVAHLFARGDGSSSGASDAEVVAACTSETFGAQVRRPLDAAAARAALSCLSNLATEWFRVQPAQYSDRTYLKRLDNGSSAAAKWALQAELKGLRCELETLQARGPPREAETTSAPREVEAATALRQAETATALREVKAATALREAEAVQAAGAPVEVEAVRGQEAPREVPPRKVGATRLRKKTRGC